uniref:biotin/lipoyl-binding protein n=1 Tax=Gemmatimonas sp. TaxID=1962908 RepID=UPI003561CA71
MLSPFRTHRCGRLVFRRRGVALALVALALVACDKGDAAGTTDSASATSTAAQEAVEEAGRPALALPVMAEEARDGDLVLRVTTTGQIRSDAAVKLRAEVAGTVTQLAVRPGQAVTKGQVLARLDGYPFDLSVR